MTYLEKDRTCLKCLKTFPSTGPGNRICKKCEKTNSQANYGKTADCINSYSTNSIKKDFVDD